MVVPIVQLASQAINALIGVDRTERIDSLNRATLSTELAFTSALLSPPLPVEHAGARWDRERGPQDAQIATIEAPDEEASAKKNSSEKYKRPFTYEAQ